MVGEKCEKCKTHFQKFHLCINFEDPEVTRVHPLKGKRISGPRSAAHRSAISEAMYERWEKERIKNAARNEKIREKYESGNQSIAMLCKEFKIGKLACRNAIEDAGGEIRKPGKTIWRPGKDIS